MATRQRPKGSGRKRIDLIGQRFERLVVIGEAPDHVLPSGATRVRFTCRCDCGAEIMAQSVDLRTGNTKSCGCLKVETVSKLSAGENHARWRGDEVGYFDAHARLRRARGSASRHNCVDCGKRAAEWSFRFPKRGEFAFSTNFDDYDPRCRPCHRTYDLKEDHGSQANSHAAA